MFGSAIFSKIRQRAQMMMPECFAQISASILERVIRRDPDGL